MSHRSLFQLTSWASSHFPTWFKDAICMFLPILHGMFLAFRMGMFRCCGVLWSTLCKISSRMIPMGSWKVSACTLYRIDVLGILGVHRQGYFTLCFNYQIFKVCEIDCAIPCPFMVIKCLPMAEYPVANQYNLCKTCPSMYLHLTFSITATLSLNTFSNLQLDKAFAYRPQCFTSHACNIPVTWYEFGFNGQCVK